MAGVPTGTGRKPPKALRTFEGTKAIREQIDGAFDAALPAVKPIKRVNEEAARACLDYIRAGGTMLSWARKAGVTYNAIRVYLSLNMRGEADKAREEGCNALAEQAIAIADTPFEMTSTIRSVNPDGSVSTTTRVEDAVYARKLAITTRLDLMKSWSPERYGSKLTVKDGGTLATAIAAARGRLGDGSDESKD